MPRIVLKELETDRAQTVSELESLIGRDPACGFVVDGPKSRVVSGRHARIFYQDAAWWIQDMSRNGTILDDERLQAGQRHALREGQVIGLGESGPRLRVTTLEVRAIAQTMLEPGGTAVPNKTTAPRQRPPVAPAPPPPAENTSAMRKSEALRAGLKVEEHTEPMSPAPDWLVQVAFRAAHTGQRFEARAMVVKVGRSPECHVRIPAEQGASVSRIHAEVAISNGGVVLRDAGSRNGTFVNGNRIQSAHPLASGDKIMLGAGGPTLEVEDLHIVKGKPTEPSRVGGTGIGGGPTPASPQSGAEAQPEPPTEPSPATSTVPPALASDRQAAYPRRGALFENVLEASPRSSSRQLRVAIWVGIAILLLATAVLLGRLSAS